MVAKVGPFDSGRWHARHQPEDQRRDTAMNAAVTLPTGQLAAYDQALAAWREACYLFAHEAGTGEQLHAAESALRAAGLDAATGLVLLPATAVHFGDVRADGARMVAVNGSLLTGEVWVCWAGRSLPYGTESRGYGAADLILIRGSGKAAGL